MTGNFIRTLFEDRNDKAPRGTGLYRSSEFCERAKRLADVQELYLQICIDLLIDGGILPYSASDHFDAVAMDMTALLAALSTRADSVSMLADMRRTLSMPFRFEFGLTANYGPWDHPDAARETEGQTFGAQLARSIRQRFDARSTSEFGHHQMMTVGRSPDRSEVFGTIKNQLSADATSLFSTRPVFDPRNDGIVRIGGLELDLVGPISLTLIEFDAFADLMCADRHKRFPAPATPGYRAQ